MVYESKVFPPMAKTAFTPSAMCKLDKPTRRNFAVFFKNKVEIKNVQTIYSKRDVNINFDITTIS